MVVGTKHVNALVKTALALIEVIGNVAGDISRVAVTLDDYSVAVVTKGGRAQPLHSAIPL